MTSLEGETQYQESNLHRLNWMRLNNTNQPQLMRLNSGPLIEWEETRIISFKYYCQVKFNRPIVFLRTVL
jgi:hypothetical protein